MNNRFFDKRLIQICGAFFILMFWFLYKQGINTGGEAGKFINMAHRLINGTPFENSEFRIFYFTFIIIIAFFLKCSLSLIWIGVFQIILSCTAGLFIYKLLSEQTGSKAMGYAGLILFLFCYPIQKWNFYIYTESIHTSLSVIGWYYFFRCLSVPVIKNIALFILFSFLIIFSRPVGIIFFLSSFFTLVFYFYNRRRFRLAGGLLIIFIAFSVILLNSTLRFYINPDSLRRMEVICQVPQTGKDLPYTQFNKKGLAGAYDVIKNEIGFSSFTKNGLLKLRYFFGLVRPYYSIKNNLFLALYLLLYPLALIGFFIYRKKNSAPVFFFCFTYLCITAVGIFLTCDEWSGRFIAPAFQYVIIPAVAGASILFKKYKNLFPPQIRIS